MPTKKEDLPSTLRRSPRKVRRTYARSLDHAREQYDSEERAHRTAFAAVEHVAEKKGDHGEPKDGKGPSDPQAAKGTPESRRQRSQTRGGIDASKSTAELYDDARRARIQGRSRMSKAAADQGAAEAQPAGDGTGAQLSEKRATGSAGR